MLKYILPIDYQSLQCRLGIMSYYQIAVILVIWCQKTVSDVHEKRCHSPSHLGIINHLGIRLK